MPKKQTIESDVVVVGYGGAGATAAIVAHDNGASVTILEKMPRGGGNTRVASGSFLNPTNRGAVEYIEALCYGKTARPIIETFVEYAMKNKEWLREIGGETEARTTTDAEVMYPFIREVSWPQSPGAQFMARYSVKRTENEIAARQRFAVALWRLLSGNVEQREIRVMTSTPAKELITDRKGQITGVLAEKDGEKVLVKAKRAVILTCGGFEYNEAMKQAFLPFGPIYAFGSSGNTGDGITMALKVGAALWHMPTISGYLGFKTPEYEAAFPIRIHGHRFIYVDRDGRRFFNETGTDHHQGIDHHDMWRVVSPFDPEHLRYARIPTYAIFDSVTAKRGPLYQGNTGPNQSYKWSQDNSAEIARGWIAQGSTIGELAERISVPRSALEHTVARYNEFCRTGDDTEFLRAGKTLEPIETLPFYAVPLWPCMLNTQGGPRRDKEARVLDSEGKPIPRLYSAGELGSLWGFLYQACGNIGECLAFGRIAGRNAALEEPVS